MEDKEKNINEEISSNIEETQEENYVIENEDNLSTDISLEQIEELDNEEAIIVAQKLEVAIEKYEDMLVKAENEFLNEQELIDLGYDDADYKRLKALEKKCYKHIRDLKHDHKEKGFLGYLPGWAAIIGAITFIFNFYPINPLLAEHFLVDQAENIFADTKFDQTFLLYFIYFLFVGVFYLVIAATLIPLLIKGRKDKEIRKSFYAYLAVAIVDILVAIPGIVKFIQLMNTL